MDLAASELVLIVVVALAATFFTVVPLLPGPLFVPAGAVAAIWLVDAEFGWTFWVVQAMFAVLGIAVDQVVQVSRIRRAGGSRGAMVGGAVGVFVGPLALAPLLGPIAVLVGPPVGAMVGTIVGEQRSRRRAGALVAAGATDATRGEYRRLGFAALAAYVVGTAIKLVLVGIQVAILAIALA